MGTFHKQWMLVLGAAVECSTAHTYPSATTSYITFCNLHNFPTEPTVERLCFYIVYMSHHIKPTSVKLYLSGICAKLEPFYPDVHAIRSSKLVNRTLTGCTKLYGSPANRKCVLTESNLLLIICSTLHHTSHDDLLFNAIVLMGWHCLLRLGELVDHDSTSLRDYRKSISHLSIKFDDDPCPHVSLFLPMHKADRFFEGSTVIFKKRSSILNPVHFFKIYLQSRDNCYPHLPQLWLRSNGRVPTRSWFINRIRTVFPSNEIAGHSLRSGGATALALAGTLLHQIQSAGHWSSNTFLIYLQKNLLLIQGSLTGRSAFDAQQNDHGSILTTGHPSSSNVTISSLYGHSVG